MGHWRYLSHLSSVADGVNGVVGEEAVDEARDDSERSAKRMVRLLELDGKEEDADGGAGGGTGA